MEILSSCLPSCSVLPRVFIARGQSCQLSWTAVCQISVWHKSQILQKRSKEQALVTRTCQICNSWLSSMSVGNPGREYAWGEGPKEKKMESSLEIARRKQKEMPEITSSSCCQTSSLENWTRRRKRRSQVTVVFLFPINLSTWVVFQGGGGGGGGGGGRRGKRACLVENEFITFLLLLPTSAQRKKSFADFFSVT